MEHAKVLRLGGYAAAGILIVFGIATIAIGIVGKSTVEDELSQEKIVGSPDMSPKGIAPGIEEAKLTVDAPDCDVAEEPITTGSEARCFAQYMRIHALESSNGLTYAEMGRYASASNPTDPAGTNDEAAAAKGEDGKPVSNAARKSLGDRDRIVDRAQHVLPGDRSLDLQHRRRGRADPRGRRFCAPRIRRLPGIKHRSEAGVECASSANAEQQAAPISGNSATRTNGSHEGWSPRTPRNALSAVARFPWSSITPRA